MERQNKAFKYDYLEGHKQLTFSSMLSVLLKRIPSRQISQVNWPKGKCKIHSNSSRHMYLMHVSPCFETHRSEQPRQTTRRQISRQFPLCRIQPSITDLSISGSLTTSFRGIAKQCCTILVAFSHPSKEGLESLLKV